MITYEEIRQIYAEQTGFDTESGHGSDIAITDFARAIYQLGRQHQRERDAALCRKNRHNNDIVPENEAWDNGTRWCEESILTNAGD